MKFGVLRITAVDGEVREVPLEQPSIIVGRAETSAVVIDDISVARRHARLAIESGRLMVEDLGSATGTFLGEERLAPNLPSLAGETARIRFGEVTAEYYPPGETATGGNGHGEGELPEGRLHRQVRAMLISPAGVAQPGGSAVEATLTVTNTGTVVDRLGITVQDLPLEWVEINPPEIVLVPGTRAEVSIRIRPPRSAAAEAGLHEFAVVITSQETGREEVATGTVSVARFDDTQVTLHPQRGKKRFRAVIENRGNGRLAYALRGDDDEGSLRYEFEQGLVTVGPGERHEVRVRVRARRQFFGGQRVDRFRVIAEPDDPEAAAQADGQLVVRPPLQRFKLPAVYLLVLVALAGGVLAYLALRPGEEREASPEDLYAGVHLCDKQDADPDGPTPTNTPDTGEPGFTGEQIGAPYFAQNNPLWSGVEYARAKDPEFGPDWCGTTIAQCGCAMTSVATVLAMYSLLEMPDGGQLTPETLNAWFNGEATRTDRGWVSRGYIYGDVIWTAVNQLSGEMAADDPGAPTIRFRTTGTGSEEEIRAELSAGRFVILEVPGHWIAAVGMEDDGTILINDPFYRDRTTLDAYKTEDGRSLVKSSVLFEPSEDLRAVVFSAPSDVRMRITDKQGRVVGTLNTGSAEEAESAAQVGIPGASYSSRQAWRDPTCVMSPPPPDAGTNQIVLPGGAEDYTVEVVDTAGRPTSVAVHTYDQEGRSTISEIKAEGSVVAEVKVDEETGAPEIDIIEDAEPTPESEITPAEGGNGNRGTPSAGNGTPTAPGGTPQPAATPTIVPADTIMSLPADAGQTRVEVASHSGFFVGDTIVFSPGSAIEEANTIVGFGSFLLATPLKYSHPAGSKIVRVAAAPPGEGGEPQGPPPAAPPLEPPDSVRVSCSVLYNASPKRATLICGATIEGEFTTTRWTSNGSVVSEATNKTSLFLSFTDDEVVVISLTSCNITICRSTSTTENIRFAAAGTVSGPAGAGTGGPTPTPTPPATGVGVSCNTVFDPLTEEALIDCLALFKEDRAFTSVSWSAPGADPSSASGQAKTFQTRLDDPNKTILITATVCNFRSCETSDPFVLAFGPTTVEVAVFGQDGGTGVFPQYTQIEIVATVRGPSPPTGGLVTFKANGQTVGDAKIVVPFGDFGVSTTTIRPPSAPMSAITTYQVTAEYSGGATLFPGTSDPIDVEIGPGLPDGCDSLDNSNPPNDQIDEDCVYTDNPKSVGGGTLVQLFRIKPQGALDFLGASPPPIVLETNGTFASGGTFVARADVTRTTYCPGCIRQVYVALAANEASGTGAQGPYCLISKVLPESPPLQLPDQTFDTPAVPGVYYLRMTGTLQYSCISVPVGGPATSVGRIIVQGKTSTSLSVNPSSYVVGDTGSITLTATVTGPGGVDPEGTVEFREGVTPLPNTAPVALVDGVATLTYPKSSLGAGTHNLTARYIPRVRDEIDNGVTFWSGSTSTGTTLTVNNPVPSTTTISPTFKNVGDAQFTLTVNGSNFVSGSTVRWNGANRTTTFVNSGQLTATIPASDLLVAATVEITVFNPSPGGGTSSPAKTFEVRNLVPTINANGLSPSSTGVGTTGFTLTINGTNFVNPAGTAGDTTVQFDGTTYSATTITSTQITVEIPDAQFDTERTVSVTVTNPGPGGGVSNSRSFTITNPTPSLTSISPTSKTAGDASFTLTANGSNFINGKSSIYFGGDTGGFKKTTTCSSSSVCTATIPAADIATAGTVNVYVITTGPGGGTAGPLTFTVNNPVPSITSLSPSSGTTGGSGFTLTVNGSNFVNGSVVRWGGTTSAENRTTTFVNSGQLTATIPSSDLAASGSVNVYVFNPTPGGGLSSAATFQVDNPVPTIATLSPNIAGAGSGAFTLTVNGTGFVNGSVVRWGGTTSAQDRVTTYVSGTQITAAILAGDISTPGPVSVYVFNPTPGGGLSTAATFTITNPPVISSLSPNSATAGGSGFTLTVNGSNFVNGAVVRWNGTTSAADRTTTFVNSGQLTASITSADIATAGSFNVYVFNPGPGGGLSAPATFTVNNPGPAITSLSPTSATAGGAQFTLTVNGSGFVSTSKVRFGGSTGGFDKTTTFVDSGQLTATIDAADIANAGTKDVYVFSPGPGGGLSGAATFTVNPVPTTTTLAIPGSPFALGATVTMTATVSPSTAPGTVRFCDGGSDSDCTGGTSLGTATVGAVNPGEAVLSRSDLAAATYNVKAWYLGDPNHAPSSSTVVTIVVNPP